MCRTFAVCIALVAIMAPCAFAAERDLFGLDETFAQLMRDFEIDDALERELFKVVLKGKAGRSSASELSIVLWRPAEMKESVRNFEWKNPDQAFTLRMTKVKTARTTSALALVTDARLVDGELVVKQRVLTYEDDETWKEFPEVRPDGR